MPAGDETGAGVLIGRKIIPAETADFSASGARLILKKKIKNIAVGDRVRVAVSSGLYEAVIRRVLKDDSGKQAIGVEFISLIKEELELRNSALMGLGSKGHHVSGSFGPATFCMIIVAVVGLYFAWRFLS